MKLFRAARVFPVMLVCALASAVNAADESSIETGRQLSQYCMGCHGKEGRTDIQAHPILAGQNAEYLKIALKAYRNGSRKGGLADIMRINARGLSDAEIEALANYYSSL